MTNYYELAIQQTPEKTRALIFVTKDIPPYLLKDTDFYNMKSVAVEAPTLTDCLLNLAQIIEQEEKASV